MNSIKIELKIRKTSPTQPPTGDSDYPSTHTQEAMAMNILELSDVPAVVPASYYKSCTRTSFISAYFALVYITSS